MTPRVAIWSQDTNQEAVRGGSPVDTHGTPWRKSSFSAINDCVAVRRLANGSIGIKNTNDDEATVLVISSEDMADWLARLKAGAFDHLVG